MADIKALGDQLVALTIKEAQELAQYLEDEHGIKPAAAAVAVAGPGGGGEAAAEEEQTEFDVVLTDIGSQKIKVIKEVRAITGAGLKEAKGMVDDVPTTIKEAVSKDEADALKARLEEVGAGVEIK